MQRKSDAETGHALIDLDAGPQRQAELALKHLLFSSAVRYAIAARRLA